MRLPSDDTIVTYPAGSVRETAAVRQAVARDGRLLVLTDRTPFHPVDARWPDQGADRGTLASAARTVPVVDCLIGAGDGGDLFVGADIPVRPGAPGWAFQVVHVLELGSIDLAPGDPVTLTVDAEHRAALSVGHTGCHLAALALNAVLAPRWRKRPKVDSLGRPDFDQSAIVSSRIEPFGSLDEYRLGRSLRKSGFDAAGLESDLPSITTSINAMLADWVSGAGAVRVEAAGPGLTDQREWVCELPEGTGRVRCGGTHVRSLADLGAVRVTLSAGGGGERLSMRCAVDPARTASPAFFSR